MKKLPCFVSIFVFWFCFNVYFVWFFCFVFFIYFVLFYFCFCFCFLFFVFCFCGVQFFSLNFDLDIQYFNLHLMLLLILWFNFLSFLIDAPLVVFISMVDLLKRSLELSIKKEYKFWLKSDIRFKTFKIVTELSHRPQNKRID